MVDYLDKITSIYSLCTVLEGNRAVLSIIAPASVYKNIYHKK